VDNIQGASRNDINSEIDLTTVEGVLMHYASLIVELTKENLSSDGGNASYKLSQSIRPEFEIKTEKFGIQYTANIIMEEYYQYADRGRAPGKNPPVEPIIDWIRNKEGFKLKGVERIGDIRERGKNKKKAYSRYDILKANAFGISRKIGLKGTKGNF